MKIDSNASILAQRLEARFEKLRNGKVTGVRVGSFGIPYAKFHEFGTKFSPKMYRWLQANLWKERKSSASKGVLQFTGKGENRAARIRPRPFVRPALKSRQPLVIDILREAMLTEAPDFTPAFTRIGNILTTEIVRNIRKQRIVDQGGLINSIRYEMITGGK